MMSAISVLLNYVHLISVCLALGVIFFIRFVSTPFLRRLAPTDPMATPVLVKTAERVLPVVWIAYSVAGVNGTLLMLMSRHYKGLFVIPEGDTWATFMLVKHGIIALMGLLLVGYTFIVKANVKRLATGLPTETVGKVMDAVEACYFAMGVGALVCAAITRYGYAWGLVIPHALHTLVLACWIGGLFFVIFIGTPAIAGMVRSGKLTQFEAVHHLQIGASRFINVLWFSMFAAIFSGFAMLFVDSEQYAGFLRNFEGSNLVMAIKQVVFLLTILGAFVVTPAIARLGQKIEYASKLSSIPKEVMEKLLKEREIIVKGAKYGFSWLQVMLLITAVLRTIRG